jgi:imidazolonepropionase-like amidohydrolase
VLAAWLAGCGAAGEVPLEPHDETSFPDDDTFLLTNARSLDDTPLTLAVLDGVIVSDDALPAGATRVDAQGAFVVPAFVDAHVHFSYAPLADEHARGGIAVALDLGAPIESLDGPHVDPLLVLRAGPMITRPGGYPLDSWGHADSTGAGGYGISCDDDASCAARVVELIERGADVIKVALLPGTLEGSRLDSVVRTAHARDRIVLAHALSDRDALRAATAGVDVLAHTPVARLSDETVRALAGRAVISTLSAFGGTRSAIENLRRLRAGGTTVLYGTDLGNTRTAGIDASEIALLVEAGLDAPAIVEAATVAPARVLGLARHGSLSHGHAGSLLLYREDPRADPSRLAHPDVVVLDGRLR